MFCKSSSVGSFGLYKLPDIVQKLRDDPSSTDKNRDGLAALIFGNLTKNQKKIAFNAIENLKNFFNNIW
jgi:hypothetical protein